MPVSLLATDSSFTRLLQRLVLGLVILPHGLQKTAGWFGGYGFDATMSFLTGAVGLPYVIALAVVAAESLGAVALVAGAGARLAALGIAAVMVGATVTTHLQHGFFMNWTGTQGGEGFEFHLLALALALPIVTAGAGAASVDGWLASRQRTSAVPLGTPASGRA